MAHRPRIFTQVLYQTYIILSLGLFYTDITAKTYTVGDFLVAWDGYSLLVRNRYILADCWISAKAPFLSAQIGYMHVQEEEGMFIIHEDVLFDCETTFQTISNLTLTDGCLVMQGELTTVVGSRHCKHNLSYNYTLNFFPAAISENQLMIQAAITSTNNYSMNNTRIILKMLSAPNEVIYGFGVQYSVVNFKGRHIPIISSEQGILYDRHSKQPLLNWSRGPYTYFSTHM